MVASPAEFVAASSDGREPKRASATRPALATPQLDSDWVFSRRPPSTARLLFLIALCAIVPYAGTLLNGFVYDDNTQVLNNPYIQNFRHLGEIFTTTVWSYVGAQGVTNYYRPMMTTGYLICYRLFGPLAYGFHLASVFLHTTVVCVLFIVTKSLLRRRDLAFGAALIFALHPIHSESVAWVAAVTDLELTLFYLLAFYFFLRLPRSEGTRSQGARFGLVGSFALALLSKEQALTLPLLATIYEHCYRDDRRSTTLQRKLSRYAVVWLLSVAYVLFRIRMFGSFAPVTQMPSLSWYQAMLSAFALTGQYLRKLLWPAYLCAFYVFNKSVNLVDGRVLLGLGAAAVIAALFVALWRRERVLSFALIWFLVTLAPVLNARWMAANVFAERYLYLPSVGFCWLVGWAAVRLWGFAPDWSLWVRRGLLAASCLVMVMCALRIVIRNRDWQNDVRLYTVTLADTPGAYAIRNNLGSVYWHQGEVKAAEREWKEALRLHPQNAIVLNNLGLLYAKEQRYDDAVDYFRRAMRLKPNYTDPHLNLGSSYATMGQTEAAELQLRAAVTLSPLNTRARNELGKLYLEAGGLVDAEEQYRRSTESEPNLVAYDSLGDIYLRRGEHDKAKQAFQSALALDPFDSHAHFGLAAGYAASAQNFLAVREYELGLRTDPSNQEAAAALRRLRSPLNDEKK